MDKTELSRRVYQGIDEDPDAPSDRAPAEVLAALNEGQELFSWLTLCLERTTTLNLMATFGNLRPILPDYLCPLKLTIDGARVRPAILKDLDAENIGWQATPGIPRRYLTLGFNFYAITPQETTLATITYARSPQRIEVTEFPEIPTEYHESLVRFGIYRVRLKEGAQGLERGMKYFGEFMDDATRLGDFVRARSRAANYDTLPLELKLFDRSRLMLQPDKPNRKATGR